MTSLFRRVLFFSAVLIAVALPAAAQEEPPPVEPPPVEWPVYDIVFPVAGPNWFSDTWGDARSNGRTHEGTDIMAEKGVPVVAAADGVVGWIGTTCCYFEIEHDGFETWYIHLNNDTPGTDDGLGWGIAPGIERGVAVTAGQLIGWVGDSGNAEWTEPHLHFEIRENGVAINSYESVLAAQTPPQPTANLWNGTFADDDDSPHEADIDKLAADGTTVGCNPPANTNYCPLRLITRGEISAFIRRTLELPSSGVDYFTDDTGSVFEDDINSVADAGIGFGCTATEYCADEALMREEMAEMLVRAFAELDPVRYAVEEGADFFTDDDESSFEDSINLLMGAGVTKGCNPPANDNFCPGRPLIRAELASFFARALGY